MDSLKYALVVLTHGEGKTLSTALATFSEMAVPEPTYKLIFKDPGDMGFCKSVQNAWAKAAALEEIDYVFWLEHDFNTVRPINLKHMADVLDENPKLAQVALIRNCVDPAEIANKTWLKHVKAVGYELETFIARSGDIWHKHHICFTTNPSLIPRKFMVENPWPDYPATCEGLFSADLRKRGYYFSSWGNEAQVQHVGQLRTGHGY